MKVKIIVAAALVAMSFSAKAKSNSDMEMRHYECEDRAKIAYNAYMIRQNEPSASKAIGDAIESGNWMLREFLISFYQIEKSHPANFEKLAEHVRNYTYTACMNSYR